MESGAPSNRREMVDAGDTVAVSVSKSIARESGGTRAGGGAAPGGDEEHTAERARLGRSSGGLSAALGGDDGTGGMRARAAPPKKDAKVSLGAGDEAARGKGAASGTFAALSGAFVKTRL